MVGAWTAPAMIAALTAVLVAIGTATAGVLPKIGSWASQLTGPMAGHSRPRESDSMARTTWGSNCAPAPAANSLRASLKLMARL